MKVTGQVRRVDDLGRVLLPKEFRKNLDIREGQQLEMVQINDCIIISKAEVIKRKEIVRCEDCKFHHREKGNWCELHDFEFDSDGYCCDGDRREAE